MMKTSILVLSMLVFGAKGSMADESSVNVNNTGVKTVSAALPINVVVSDDKSADKPMDSKDSHLEANNVKPSNIPVAQPAAILQADAIQSKAQDANAAKINAAPSADMKANIIDSKADNAMMGDTKTDNAKLSDMHSNDIKPVDPAAAMPVGAKADEIMTSKAEQNVMVTDIEDAGDAIKSDEKITPQPSIKHRNPHHRNMDNSNPDDNNIVVIPPEPEMLEKYTPTKN